VLQGTKFPVISKNGNENDCRNVRRACAGNAPAPVSDADGGLPAGDLSLGLGIPQNTLSFHLREMQNAGLIDSRRAGRFIIYRTVPESMKELLRYLIDNCAPK
jgi:DNA-binding transcriptional ArsR family regulator